MGYVYAAMWFIAGLILIFRLSKENKIFYVAGGFFLCAWRVVAFDLLFSRIGKCFREHRAPY